MNTVIFTGTVSLRPSVQNSPRFFIRKHRGVLQKSSSDSLSRKMAVNPLSIVRARFSGGRGGGGAYPGTAGRADSGLRARGRGACRSDVNPVLALTVQSVNLKGHGSSPADRLRVTGGSLSRSAAEAQAASALPLARGKLQALDPSLSGVP